MAKTKKYVVTLTGNETGTLNNDLFRKMASKGDITSTAISDLVDEALTIRGTAQATIETKHLFLIIMIQKKKALFTAVEELFSRKVILIIQT